LGGKYVKKSYTKRKPKRKSDSLFNCTPIEVYNAVVMGKIKKFPDHYMTKKIAKILVTHVIVEELKFNREDICKKLKFKVLTNNNLGGVRKLFHNCLYEMINYVFKGMKIKPWELDKVTIGFWKSEENRDKFTLWVAKKEGLDITKLEDARKITAVLIEKKGGPRVIKEAGGLHKLIIHASGNLYKEWEFVKINSWNDDKVKEAVKWLIEEKLKWSHEDVCNGLTAQTFYDNYLGGMLSRACSNSPIVALEKAYPGEYKKEDLKKGEEKRKSVEHMKEMKNKKTH
jgi:hypothetical protein